MLTVYVRYIRTDAIIFSGNALDLYSEVPGSNPSQNMRYHNQDYSEVPSSNPLQNMRYHNQDYLSIILSLFRPVAR
jgi:hypothetical protein